MSGFDPITYYVLSDWEVRYNVYRHPLLAFWLYPFFLLNKGLMAITGINCALFIATTLQLVFACYGWLFCYRIIRHLIGLSRNDATLLSFYLFGQAYVLLSVMVPDHFLFSLTLLLAMVYVGARRMQANISIGAGYTWLFFILTAGVTLSNGVKVFVTTFIAKGKKFFHWRYLLFNVLLPAALMWQCCQYTYRYFVLPGELQRKEIQARKKAENKKKQAQKQMATAQKNGEKAAQPKNKAQHKPKVSKNGKPFMDGAFMQWSDATTNRVSSWVENMTGEAILLHRDHLLQDVLRQRPVIVPYRTFIPYILLSSIVLLTLAGAWYGRKHPVWHLVLGCFAIDVALHLGLGFGINEIYIMSPHWAFIYPIAFSFVLTRLSGHSKTALRALLLFTTILLYAYNGTLIVQEMCKQLSL